MPPTTAPARSVIEEFMPPPSTGCAARASIASRTSAIRMFTVLPGRCEVIWSELPATAIAASSGAASTTLPGWWRASQLARKPV